MYIVLTIPTYYLPIRVRREIFDVLELPFRHPELFRSGCPRRQGVLLYGPPGKSPRCVPYCGICLYIDCIMYITIYLDMYTYYIR